MRIRRTLLGTAAILAVLLSAERPAEALLLEFIPPGLQRFPADPHQPPVTPPQHQDAFQSAMEALQAGDLDKAQAEFVRASGEKPGSPLPHLGLAEVAHRKGDAATTEAELQAAIAADPKSADVQTAWGTFLVTQKRDPEARTAFETAISLAPLAVAPRMALADMLLTRLDQPEKAVELYQAVIAVQPETAPAHIGLGAALARLDHLDDAVAEFTKAEKEVPSDPQPSYLLGKLQAARGNVKEALIEFDRATGVQPNFIPAHIGKADLLLANQDYGGAIAEYLAALVLDPHMVPALINLGLAQQQDHRIDDAIMTFKRVVELDSKQPVALNNLAWIAADRRENLNDALAWAQQAVSIAPKDASFVDTLGWVYRARGQLPEAKVQFTHSLALRADPETAYHLGLVNTQLGHPIEAETAFRRALELDAKYAPAAAALKALPHPK